MHMWSKEKTGVCLKTSFVNEFSCHQHSCTNYQHNFCPTFDFLAKLTWCLSRIEKGAVLSKQPEPQQEDTKKKWTKNAVNWFKVAILVVLCKQQNYTSIFVLTVQFLNSGETLLAFTIEAWVKINKIPPIKILTKTHILWKVTGQRKNLASRRSVLYYILFNTFQQIV